MRKIIDGKVYDTETAKFLAEFESNFAVNDFNWYMENLYIKKTGEYFLYGKGNGLTSYKKSMSGGGWTSGEKIIPLSEEEAQKWAEENIESKEYEEIFGEITEDDDFCKRLKNARSEAGKTQAEIATALEIPQRTIESWEQAERIPAEYLQNIVLREIKNLKK